MIHQTKRRPSIHDGRIGEQGLILINNDQEWKTLMQNLRTSGISTNGAARAMILEYLQRKQQEQEDAELIDASIAKHVQPHQSMMPPRLRRKSLMLMQNVRSSCARIKERRLSIS